MKNKIIKKVALSSIFLAIIPTITLAEQSTKDIANIIDIAGKQRMISQRIAKDYMYVGNKIAVSRADKQLKASLNDFYRIHKKLESLILDSEIKNLLSFVSLSVDELKVAADKDFTLDNAQLVLDLTEAMLEGNQYVVDSLKKHYKVNPSSMLDTAAKQRMLSQRIAKYYIAYQSGIKDDNTIKSMKETVRIFSKNLKQLINNKNNTPQINKKLKEIDRLWGIVHKFYNNIEKGGLPLIVFNSTDKITKKMNEITILYVNQYQQ